MALKSSMSADALKAKLEAKLPDVDDQHADREHGRKKADVGKGPQQQKTQKERPAARKPGHITDSEDEEQVADPQQNTEGLRDKEKQAPPKKPKPSKEKKRRDGSKGESEDQPPQEKPKTTAGHLAFDSNYHHRRTQAQRMGFDGTPGVEELVVAYEGEEEEEGQPLGVMFPGTRARAHPDLPEVEIRPPDFLNPLESMKDIYMKMKGRMSRRTKELIEHIDLEDLIELLYSIFEDEAFSRSSEGRIRHDLWAQLKDDPGPLLLGLIDPRLTELWRLLLEGWDIWVIEGQDRGIDLFWEGEAEDDNGEVIELMQSLQFLEGEVTLHTKMGDIEDKVTFDGESFYRLKHERPVPKRDNAG